MSPLQRLRTHSVPFALDRVTTALPLRAVDSDENVCGVGTALVVQTQTPTEFQLVSARHVIARAKGLRLFADVLIEGSEQRRMLRSPIELSSDWDLSPDDDIARAPLDPSLLPDKHLVSAIPLERFGYIGLGPTPELTLVGRWGFRADRNYIIARRGILATMERPVLETDIGPDLSKVELEMYVADATVTVGMSGGPVFFESSPPMLIGIISAHHKIVAAPDAFAELPPSAQQAALAIWDAISPMNAGLVYIVPFNRVAAFVMRPF